MGYRGDDLDLRTPQGHNAPPVDVGAWRDGDGLRGRPHHGGVLNGPIMVDETVLACCNHAYDVALAHGAAEVRLEHFLNALTRIDAAAEALEARGVRVAALRRESASVIAGEIPSTSSKTAGSPRRTQELEDVLRLAASNASRRSEPAKVDDIIHVILDEEPDLPGLALLASVTSRRSARRPIFDTLPQLPHRSGPSESRNYLNDNLRNRYRLSQPTYGTSETGNGHASNTRIDALEQTISSLIGDISADRKALASAMQELQGEVVAQRDEMIDGFNALNQAIHNSRSDAIDLTPINDRVISIGRETSGKLNALEHYMDKLISKPNADLASINKRLESIEDVITARSEDHSPEIATRLAKLEDALGRSQARATEQHDGVLHELAQVSGRLEKHRSDVIGGVLTPLAQRVERQRDEIQALLQPVAERMERVEKLGQSADGHEARTTQALSGVLDRFTRLEKGLTEWAQSTQQAGAAYAKELGEVEEVLVKLTEGQRGLSGSFSAWRQEGSSALQTLVSRVDVVEQQGARANSMLEQLAVIVERMHQVTTARYMKRNRMRYWLFGTDDWISASWPSQANRIAEALNQGKITKSI